MTTDRQLERLLDGWLAEGATVVADRVIDDAASRISRQPQRPAWRLGSWKLPVVSAPGRLALVAALLAITLFAGGMLLAGRLDSSPPPSIPTAIDRMEPGVPTIPDGPLPAGTYAVRPAGAQETTFFIDVPDGGWTAWSGAMLGGPGGSQAPGGVALAFYAAPGLRNDDPCHPIDNDRNLREDLLGGFEAKADATVSNVTQVKVGDRDALRLDVGLHEQRLPCGFFYPVDDRDGIALAAAPQAWRVWLVDVGDSTAMIVRFAHPGTSAADLAAADAIAAATRIGRPRTMENGPIEAGTYGGTGFPSWSFTVPAGWSSVRDWELYPTDLGPAGATAAGEPNGLALAYFYGTQLVLDSCAARTLSTSTTAAELMTAIQAKRDWIVTKPVDVTLGGFAGQRVDVALPTDLSSCAGPYYVFRDPSGPASENMFWAQGPDNRLRIWALDVNGWPVVLVRSSFAATPADALAEADAIIDSIVITP